MGSTGLRIHGTCAAPGACGVSMNGRVYETSNVSEVTYRLEKINRFISKQRHGSKRSTEVLAADRSASTDSGPQVAPTIALILQDGIALSLWKRLCE